MISFDQPRNGGHTVLPRRAGGPSPRSGWRRFRIVRLAADDRPDEALHREQHGRAPRPTNDQRPHRRDPPPAGARMPRGRAPRCARRRPPDVNESAERGRRRRVQRESRGERRRTEPPERLRVADVRHRLLDAEATRMTPATIDEVHERVGVEGGVRRARHPTPLEHVLAGPASRPKYAHQSRIDRVTASTVPSADGQRRSAPARDADPDRDDGLAEGEDHDEAEPLGPVRGRVDAAIRRPRANSPQVEARVVEANAASQYGLPRRSRTARRRSERSRAGAIATAWVTRTCRRSARIVAGRDDVEQSCGRGARTCKASASTSGPCQPPGEVLVRLGDRERRQEHRDHRERS